MCVILFADRKRERDIYRVSIHITVQPIILAYWSANALF